MQNLLKWLAFFFIIYVFATQQNDHKTPPSPTQPIATQEIAAQPQVPAPNPTGSRNLASIVSLEPSNNAGFLAKTLAKGLNAVLGSVQVREPIASKAIKDIVSNSKLLREKVGTGSSATYCGATIDLAYKITHPEHGQVIASNLGGAPLTYMVGANPKAKTINQLLIGMKAGGEKEVLLDYNEADKLLLYTHRNSPQPSQQEKWEVKLLLKVQKIAQENYQQNLSPPLQIFYKLGGTNSQKAVCGDIVQFSYVIKNVDGTQIFPASGRTFAKLPLRFGSMPVAIERVLYGMSANEERAVLTSGKHLENTSNAAMAHTIPKLDAQKIFLVEVTLAGIIAT